MLVPYRGTSLIRHPALGFEVGLCLGAYGGPRGVAVSCERGTPVRSLTCACLPPAGMVRWRRRYRR